MQKTHNTINISFQIWHKVTYGKAVYLLGNTDSLGNWNPKQAIRLNWTQEDIWVKDLSLTDESEIQYKYLIADYKDPEEFVWEKGPNRTIKLKKQYQFNHYNFDIIRDDKWQQRKIVIKLVDEQLSNQFKKMQIMQQNLKLLKSNNEHKIQQFNKINNNNINNKVQKLQQIYDTKVQNDDDEISPEHLQFFIRGNITLYNSNNQYIPIKMQQKSKNPPSQEEILSCHELFSPENVQFLTQFSQKQQQQQQNSQKNHHQSFDNSSIQQSSQYQQNNNQDKDYPDFWWEGHGWIDIVQKQKVKYCFQKKINNEYLSDRQVRKISIQTLFETRDKLILKNSQTVFNFQYDRIDENIFLGPYPQGIDNIEEIKQQGVKAVLNLQTEEDMEFRGIKWSEQQQLYEKNNISAVNFPIIDMDCLDMSTKLIQVSKVLDLMIQQYGQVYVHCTAGIFRSPQTVIGYFCFFKKFHVSNAIALVELQHPICKKNRIYLKTVLQNLLQAHHSEEESQLLNNAEQYEKELNYGQNHQQYNNNGINNSKQQQQNNSQNNNSKYQHLNGHQQQQKQIIDNQQQNIMQNIYNQSSNLEQSQQKQMIQQQFINYEIDDFSQNNQQQTQTI